MHTKLKEDKKAKTKAFFFKKEDGVVFNLKLKNLMIDYFKMKKKDVRICLHQSSKDKHHDMIILQQKKNYYTPHKHLAKGETYHMIVGSMMCILFNKIGKIKKVVKINKNEIFRVPKNTVHTMMPISKYTIYHENKPGPFLKKGDSIIPKWAKKYINKSRLVIELKKFNKRINDK
jgi:cupin fold WbuC family metalloprotein